jgi:hypothetical protein
MGRDIQIHIRADVSLDDIATAMSERFNVVCTKERNRLDEDIYTFSSLGFDASIYSDVDSRFGTRFVLNLCYYAHPDPPFDNEDFVGVLAVFLAGVLKRYHKWPSVVVADSQSILVDGRY